MTTIIGVIIFIIILSFILKKAGTIFGTSGEFARNALKAYVWLGDEDALDAAIAASPTAEKVNLLMMDLTRLSISLSKHEDVLKAIGGMHWRFNTVSENISTDRDYEGLASEAKKRLEAKNHAYLQGLESDDGGVFVERYPYFFKAATLYEMAAAAKVEKLPPSKEGYDGDEWPEGSAFGKGRKKETASVNVAEGEGATGDQGSPPK